MKTIAPFVLFLFMPMVNNAQTEYKIVVADSAYQLTVPAYLEEVHDLVEGPALQMKYLGEPPLLLTVRAEKKSMINALDTNFTHNDYHQFVSSGVTEKLTEATLSSFNLDTTNNNPYIEGRVYGKFQGTPLVYYVRTIETKDCYYQIIVWTEERCIVGSTLGYEIVQIMSSFEVLNEK